jgi:uncharacterized protein with LGFP repeats
MRKFATALIALSILAQSSSSFAYQVYGSIGDKWAQLGAASGPLGASRSDEMNAARGGRFNEFQNGFIYWHPSIGAHAVYGLIGEKWNQLGRERGLGYPLTDEQPAARGGRFNDFENNASIYWHSKTGAHAVYGFIRDRWSSAGRERGRCGYPISDEYTDGSDRRSDFEYGFIRWSPQAGATIVGCIVDKGPALNPARQ